MVFISSGSIQLLVGPASFSNFEQINVLSSTRATSSGSELAKKDPGRFSGLSGLSVPAAIIFVHKSSYSSLDPSHQYISLGWVNDAISFTQSSTF